MVGEFEDSSGGCDFRGNIERLQPSVKASPDTALIILEIELQLTPANLPPDLQGPVGL